MNEKHIGTDFDDFLKEEGLYEHCQAVATKRLLAYHLNQFMKENNVSKTDMAARLYTSRVALDRILDPDNTSITLATLVKVAGITGITLSISVTKK